MLFRSTISAGNRIKELLRDVADEMDGGLSVSPMKQVILNQIDFHEVNIRRNEEALASFKGVLAMHPDNVSLKESIATSEASLAAHQGSLDNLKGHLQNA